MTRDEAIKYLIKPVATSTEIGEEKQKEFEAYHMAIEALQKDAERQEMIIRASEKYLGLVRCKDCRYREMDGEVTHFYWCRINDRPVDDVDFCAWGEESEVEE